MSEPYTQAMIARLRARLRGVDDSVATVSERVESEVGPKMDGRSLRRTGRTEQLAVRVTAETKRAYQTYADEHGILMAEVLERGLEALKARAS